MEDMTAGHQTAPEAESLVPLPLVEDCSVHGDLQTPPGLVTPEWYGQGLVTPVCYHQGLVTPVCYHQGLVTPVCYHQGLASYDSILTS